MRELQLVKWCDVCRIQAERELADDDLDDDITLVPAPRSFTLGILQGDGQRPAVKVIDVCERHAKDFDDLHLLMTEIHQTPGAPPPSLQARKSRAPKAITSAAPATPGTRECPVCGQSIRMSLVAHVWARHRADRRPPEPQKCPECGRRYDNGTAMGGHRRGAHGYDPLAEVLAGVPRSEYTVRPALPAGHQPTLEDAQ